MTLPKGLDETIAALIAGCKKKHIKIHESQVREKMIERLSKDFKEQEGMWNTVQFQILAVGGLSGRLAAAYARLDHKDTADWHHVRLGLRDGKAECILSVGAARAKHCANADFEHD
jgi:hypothetical protein